MNDWLIWQIVDSAFPTGAFAHSWGLESAWHHGEVPDSDALHAFLETSVLQAGFAVLPFVSGVHRSTDVLPRADALSEAFLTNPVANRASRIQGRTLLATAARIWPSPRLDRVRALAEDTRMHAAPLTGAVLQALDVPLSTAQRITLFITARGVLSAAIRLGIVGPYEAQRLQYASSEQLETVARGCADLSIDDAAQTAPVIDLLQSAHDRLYSRLFQS